VDDTQAAIEDLMALVREYGALRIDHDRSRTLKNAHACDRSFEAIQAYAEKLASPPPQTAPGEVLDAARYRWLKKGGPPAVGYLGLLVESSKWDAAIDAAMKQG
jgi:hypothetical protein